MSLKPTHPLLQHRRICLQLFWLLATCAFLLATMLHADNKVMGEIELQGRSKVEKTSGVWIDGQYVGYLKELKGDKKVLLLPGDHDISVRQNGYQDFHQRITVRPGQKLVIPVMMQKGPSGALPGAWSVVKINVAPSRAAVFLDGRFVGHVGEFQGMGRSLEIVPGSHRIKITLPGYKTFETEINPLPKQKVEVKTQLVKTDNPLEDPSLKGIQEDRSIPAPEPAPPPQPQ
jgi:PEGA domain